MSKNGKLKKAKNVEKRRMQMQEAMECLPLKEAARVEPAPAAPIAPVSPVLVVAAPPRTPKQCSFKPCERYVDPTCTVCPYCGTPFSN